MSEFKGYGIADCIGVLFDPRFWFRNYRVSREWGQSVERALDREAPQIISQHSALLAGKRIWISNWPYAYGAPGDEPLPPRRTAIRLRKAVDRALLSKIKGEEQ